MAPIQSALSETLRSLTQSKIRELEKRRQAYESNKTSLLQTADRLTDIQDKTPRLLSGVKALFPQTARDPVITDIERWLSQARYDSSISLEKLVSIQDQLISRLDVNSRRLGLADLYSRLVMEWVNVDAEPNPSPGDSSSDNDDYSVVEEKQKLHLENLCDQFEKVVFEPLETNPVEIRAFLEGLFPDEESRTALEAFQADMRIECLALWERNSTGNEVFNTDSLTLCIKGLLKEDILSDAKKEMLKYFLDNEVALIEIADVLNMRYDDLSNWEWHAGEDGIPVLPTQQLNGKYRIWMDEDVLQTIFVQQIGVRLCAILKEHLEKLILNESVWNWSPGPSMIKRDRLRREYYLGEKRESSQSVAKIRKDEYMDTYFVSQLPKSEWTLAQHGGSYDDEEDDEEDDDKLPTKEEDKNVKQHLLRKVATEALLHRALHGEAAAIQSDLKWYGTSLSHSTIFTIMEFAGFPKRWITFFCKYLESPLNMDQALSGREPRGPRTRKRGLPMAHASEKLLGEMVLFFMDLAVNRETGMLLYRLHDDLWLCGEPEKCARAWEVMNKFAKVTGLEFNVFKTGSVYLSDSRDTDIEARLPTGPVTIGFLTLDPESGDWKIDQSQVDEHLNQLHNQLQSCDSVISWIRTWNSCIGRFFKSNFGQPAYCFGRPHVDEILETYEKVNRVLFGSQNPENGSTLTEHLRHMIKSRFGVSDMPDAFFFLPEELGGLGLRNPFIPVLLVRDSKATSQSPSERMQALHESLLSSYASRKKEFENLTDEDRHERLEDLRTDSDEDAKDFIDPITFMSFDEYMQYADTRNSDIADYYTISTQVAAPTEIEPTPEYSQGLSKLQETIPVADPPPEVKWVLHLYASELMARFGGLNLVDRRFLPVGVLTMIKERKVKWQMVL
ncbi:uncharacterized protein LDX57_010449 [Aspergillus melleus]|uniref:uncharacterized protein n=1 Tax=Aspergillus melleus TaxID=138277 RepID=UPI001E8D33F7|nr:uncharacterized protein LDX57_010449 [Aspergillus melleus]KAH8432820.1 hypothetical protein LDX57_010449 [Aspergillus melleus]